jgi:hypothetical protein
MTSADSALDQQAAEQKGRIGRRAAGPAAGGDEEGEADETDSEHERDLVLRRHGGFSVGLAPRRATRPP